MKIKQLNHSWKKHPNPHNYLESMCTKCGCIRRYDDILGSWIFIRDINNVTRRSTRGVSYDRPSCIHPENSPKLIL